MRNRALVLAKDKCNLASLSVPGTLFLNVSKVAVKSALRHVARLENAAATV